MRAALPIQWVRGFALFAVPLLTPLFWQPAGAVAQTIPGSYQAVYTELNTYLASFDAQIGSSGPGSAYAGMPTASLTDADANQGALLLNSGALPTLQLQLQELKAIGIQAVVVKVGFPMLYQPFLQMENQPYSSYAAFYQQLAATVRGMGLKLIVENDVLSASGVAGTAWNTESALSAATWVQYQQARAQTAVAIAQTMQPDYMVVVEESDTEAANAGQAEVNTPSGAASMLSGILAGMQQAGVSGVRIGAGVGTWLPGFQDFVQDFLALPINFLDMHVYYVNGANLANAVSIASMAASASMPVTISESWLDKVADSEAGVLSGDAIAARNPFSFWEPLDVLFVQTMAHLGAFSQMTFVNVALPQYFFAYLPYGPGTQNLTPSQILSMETTQATEANTQASYTQIGMAYYNSIVVPRDTVAPAMPSNLAGTSSSATTASLTWNGSTDNVGVAGYAIYRNGVGIGMTGPTSYQDAGLAGGTTYSYTVRAFDLAGNLSAYSAAVQVTTQAGPPAAPTLSAQPVSCIAATLTWSVGSGSLPGTSYRVLAGSTPSHLSQIAMVATLSFSASPLNPATTYYYAVQSMDGTGGTSPMSSVVPVTTPSLPSAPQKVTARVVAKTVVGLTWKAATGPLGIASYTIYRGSAPAALAPVAKVNSLETSYSDLSVQRGRKYYYAVQALDSAADPSLLSTTVTVTLPK